MSENRKGTFTFRRKRAWGRSNAKKIFFSNFTPTHKSLDWWRGAGWWKKENSNAWSEREIFCLLFEGSVARILWLLIRRKGVACKV